MAFTDSQVRQLKAKLDPRYIKTRSANGVHLSYVEGWHAMPRPTASSALTPGTEELFQPHACGAVKAGQVHAAAYIAKVRVSVRAADTTIVGKAQEPGKAELQPRGKHMN